MLMAQVLHHLFYFSFHVVLSDPRRLFEALVGRLRDTVTEVAEASLEVRIAGIAFHQ